MTDVNVTGGLTRARIVDAALDLARREGLAALTMRRLADELGVTPMAAYRHVSGKPELLQAMAEVVWDSLRIPPQERPGDPREQVVQFLVGVRRHLLDHGELAEVASWRPSPSPEVTGHVAAVVEVLGELGFTEAQIPAVFSSLATFTLGHIQFEAGRARADRVAAEGGRDGLEVPDDLDLAPAAGAVVRQIVEDPDRDVMFEFGLQRLLDGLLAWSASEAEGGQGGGGPR